MMTWRWQLKGEHVHALVFMNGALCGKLVFREEEFEAIRRTQQEYDAGGLISFVEAKL